MFKERLLTASVLIPIFTWEVIQADSHSLAVLFALVILIAAWEWGGICGWNEQHKRWLYSGSIVLCLIASQWLLEYFPTILLSMLLITLAWWLFATLWLARYQLGYDNLPSSTVEKALIGGLILVPAWNALFILHYYYGGQWVLFLFILIWTADSGAYLSGKRFGKQKLADKISPGKTWEGVFGALLMSFVVALLYVLWFTKMSLLACYAFLFLCLITVIASIVGDLLESLFKRKAGLKDSSRILPGHGGILDRIDSMTAAAPIFVLGLILLSPFF